MLLKKAWHERIDNTNNFILENDGVELLAICEKDKFGIDIYVGYVEEIANTPSAYTEYKAINFIDELKNHETTRLLLKKYIELNN